MTLRARDIASLLAVTDTFKERPMELTSTFCREQEAFQRNRAASAVLDNVRVVASRAAAAWAYEALAADRREASRERLRMIACIAAVEVERPGDREEAGQNENPDRGGADA